MEFKDIEVNNLKLEDLYDFAQLVVKYLCNEEYCKPFSKNEVNLLQKLISLAKSDGFSYQQFNELLLLLEQDIISAGFFKFFFDMKEIIELEDLRKGVIKFRGFAMLSFGNFRFAYKKLITMQYNEIIKELKPYCIEHAGRKREFTSRSDKRLDINNIGENETVYTGELTCAVIKEEAKLSAKLKADAGDNVDDSIYQVQELIVNMDTIAREIQEKALNNTDIYLTWDYMDVYIATSMRNSWEFKETYKFIGDVFADKNLSKLKLRFFNPTQSKCMNARDKGIVEGLMLKRVLCTLYMVQESDTMGKDSELAATLAQRRPVIAYVPRHDPSDYAGQIYNYPLEYFKKRLLILRAEGLFEKREVANNLKNIDSSFSETTENFLTEFNKYRSTVNQFTLWVDRDNEFKKECKYFNTICQILAKAECMNFDKRAEVLKVHHPLAMQVDLKTGVANGVFVVRDAKQCATLLYQTITNSVQFTIKHPKLFNVSKREFDHLKKLQPVFETKFEYDKPYSTLNLIKGLTEKEVADIEKLADSEEFSGDKWIDLSIKIRHIRSQGATILEEEISGSTHRVVTDNTKLTNSFWNLWY